MAHKSRWMTLNDMRKYVSNAYPSLEWKAKVASMPTNQVYAIFQQLKKKEKKEEEQYHQMDIWEWAYECNKAAGGKETHTEVRV